MSKDLWKEKHFCPTANNKNTFPELMSFLKEGKKKKKLNIQTAFLASSGYESRKAYQDHIIFQPNPLPVRFRAVPGRTWKKVNVMYNKLVTTGVEKCYLK